MKVRYCKFIGCPRLVTATTEKGCKPFAQCNQQMPDTAPYWVDCSSVSHERCKELRKALKERREVQGC